MFTGIVADVGKLSTKQAGVAGYRMVWATGMDTADFELGESIAVNGVCLTVDAVEPGTFATDASPETLERSNLGALAPGDPVNLERALRPMDRLGGHFMLGHVDGAGTLISRAREGEFEVFGFDAPAEVARYLVAKGSVAVDGISLTVASLTPSGFTVALIPHTLTRTTLAGCRPGRRVNLEADVLGKYVEKLLRGERAEADDIDGGLTMEKLAESGFLG